MRGMWGAKLPLKERIGKYLKMLEEYKDKIREKAVDEHIKLKIESNLNNDKRNISAEISVTWRETARFENIEEIDEYLLYNKVMQNKLIELKSMMQKEINLTK